MDGADGRARTHEPTGTRAPRPEPLPTCANTTRTSAGDPRTLTIPLSLVACWCATTEAGTADPQLKDQPGHLGERRATQPAAL